MRKADPGRPDAASLERRAPFIAALSLKSRFLAGGSRRRRALLAALLAIALAAALTGIAANRQVPVLARLDDAIVALVGRSPGARAQGALGKAARAGGDRAGALPGPAVERALGKTFPPEFTAPSILGAPPAFALDDTLAPVALGAFPHGGGGSSFPAGSGGFSGRGQGSGGGGGGTAPPVAPPVGMVPEPATWMLMCAGAALVGGLLRRRNARSRAPS